MRVPSSLVSDLSLFTPLLSGPNPQGKGSAGASREGDGAVRWLSGDNVLLIVEPDSLACSLRYALGSIKGARRVGKGHFGDEAVGCPVMIILPLSTLPRDLPKTDRAYRWSGLALGLGWG